MADSQINVTFTCSRCGPAFLELPDNYTDDDHAKCKNCGADFGPYGNIKKMALSEAEQEVRKMMENAFKGIRGWKVS